MVGRLKIGCVVVLTLGLGLLTGCSSTPTSPALEVEADPSDPFENVNRKITLLTAQWIKTSYYPWLMPTVV